MRYFQKMQWVGFIVVLMLGVIGCEMFGDSDLSTPSSSTGLSPNSDRLANFWVNRGQNKFEVTTGNEVIQVGTPTGAYLLQYSVKMPLADGGFEIQEFSIVFKTGENGALLTIGLKPGDEIWGLQLIPGEISENIQPVQTTEEVAIFIWPGDESSLTVDDVFEMPENDADIRIIILIAEGVIAPIVVNGEGLELNIQIQIEIDSELPITKYTITTNVIPGTIGGTITPEKEEGVPFGSSRSFKIRPNSRVFTDILDMTIEGKSGKVSVLDYVQELGNGDGHLVIHDITENLIIEVTFK